jgi:hypothetical protein
MTHARGLPENDNAGWKLESRAERRRRSHATGAGVGQGLLGQSRLPNRDAKQKPGAEFRPGANRQFQFAE